MIVSQYRILDACCGSRMFWFDPQHPSTVFADLHCESHVLCNGQKSVIAPTVQCDFRQMPFADDSFALVIFDPPHLHGINENTWMAKKFGRLFATWRDDLRAGFDECWRVLRPEGTLIFKWNEYDIPVSQVLSCFPVAPLIGHKSGKQSQTHWLTFMKLRRA